MTEQADSFMHRRPTARSAPQANTAMPKLASYVSAVELESQALRGPRRALIALLEPSATRLGRLHAHHAAMVLTLVQQGPQRVYRAAPATTARR